MKVRFDYDGDEETYFLPKEAADLRLAPMRTGARVGISNTHAADVEVRPKRWRCDGKDAGEHVGVTAAVSPHKHCSGACERLSLCAARLVLLTLASTHVPLCIGTHRCCMLHGCESRVVLYKPASHRQLRQAHQPRLQLRAAVTADENPQFINGIDRARLQGGIAW